MIAPKIAAALGGKREGREWRCPCPVHGGHSLTLADGRDGKLLAKCFAGCEWRDIFAALRRLGLVGSQRLEIGPERQPELHRREQAEAKAEIERLRRGICAARDLCSRSVALQGTPGEAYLRARRIVGPMPQVLRFLAACPHRNGRYYPAMVAPIVNISGEQVAVHKTFLRPDGSGKADLPKEERREVRGPMRGGAARLAQYRPGHELIVGEGVESTLSAMQLFGAPGWAALSASGIEVLDLPAEVRFVVIAADCDTNGTGQRAALAARERWEREGRRVEILTPPILGADFNDLLCCAESR